MKAKTKRLLGGIGTILFASALLSGCSDKGSVKHQHVFKDVEGVSATCTHEGKLAYEECIYCKKDFINGEEVSKDSLIIPVDANAHTLENIDGNPATCVSEGNKSYSKCEECGKYFIDSQEVEEADTVLAIDPTAHHLVDVAKVEPSCVKKGVQAHQECDLCGTWFLNGEAVSKTDLDIAATGTHDFSENPVKCANCDAYKLDIDGDYQLVDDVNHVEFKDCLVGNAHTATDKQTYFDSLIANCNTFATQASDVSVVDDGDSWTIEKNPESSFTRFHYGIDDVSYVGRFLMVFDVQVPETVSVTRFGVKIASNTASVVGSTQDKLLGTNASEENNPDRAFEGGKTYRFAYDLETTAENQIVQIFTCVKAASLTLSNLHLVPLSETPLGKADSKLLYFGDPDGIAFTNEDCQHAYRRSVAKVSATCTETGIIAHDHCSRCGKDLDGDTVLTSVIAPTIEHDYGDLIEAVESTCTENGHSAYYHCSVCGKYFDSEKMPLSGLPILPLKAHEPGPWVMTSTSHYKVCALCGEHLDEGEHRPGPAATETTAQTCLDCGYVLAEALSHVHTMGALVPAKDATCTEDGNVAYYQCETCHKYYSDAAGTNELTTVIIPKGHVLGDLVPAKEATCTEDGNVAYYHCSRCGKYFSDEEATNDISDSYLITKLGHSIVSEPELAATAYTYGHSAYYHCPTCDTYYSDEAGNNAITGDSVHQHSYVNGVCSVCGSHQLTQRVKDGSAWNGTQAATVNGALAPGYWVFQNCANCTMKMDSGSFSGSLASNSKDKANKQFMRYIPAKEDGSAYVGKYLYSFDFKVTAAKGSYSKSAAKLYVGYFIQSLTESGNAATLADVTLDFNVGVTYRFGVVVETLNENQFLQFNVRNTPNSGADYLVSKPSIQFMSGTPIAASLTSDVA